MSRIRTANDIYSTLPFDTSTLSTHFPCCWSHFHTSYLCSDDRRWRNRGEKWGSRGSYLYRSEYRSRLKEWSYPSQEHHRDEDSKIISIGIQMEILTKAMWVRIARRYRESRCSERKRLKCAVPKRKYQWVRVSGYFEVDPQNRKYKSSVWLKPFDDLSFLSWVFISKSIVKNNF